MKRVVSGWLALGTMAVVGASGFLIACNGLLGIGVASQEVEDSGAAADAEAGKDPCTTYCNLMEANCAWSTAYGEYLNVGVCMAMCPVFDVGRSPGPTNDDTLGCRLFYAGKAQQDPATNCAFAGILGGGKCGTTPCTEFCGAEVQYCSNPPVSSPQYQGGTAECEADCQAGDGGLGYPYVKEDGGGDISGIDKGNTLNCRTWHLNNAYKDTQSGQFHCQHTKQNSAPCSGPAPDSGLIIP